MLTRRWGNTNGSLAEPVWYSGLTKEVWLEAWLEARSGGMRDEGGFPVGLACRWEGPDFTLVASVLLSCWEQAGRKLTRERERERGS